MADSFESEKAMMSQFNVAALSMAHKPNGNVKSHISKPVESASGSNHIPKKTNLQIKNSNQAFNLNAKPGLQNAKEMEKNKNLKNVSVAGFRPSAKAANVIVPLGDEVTDTALISSLTKRVSALEEQSNTLRKVLREKEQFIIELSNKCKLYEDTYSEVDQNLLSELQKENNRCKLQISEMESFLNDYGLVWVGYRDEPIETSEKPDDSLWFDMSDMSRAIKDLNLTMIETAKTKIVKENGVHRFHNDIGPSESIVFYKNGIYFRNGPLRLYSLPACRSFCNDILDGYFPSELKDEFPDGLSFEFTDKSREMCAFRHVDIVNPNASQDSTANSVKPVSKISTEDFLKKLPQNVIRGGQVVSIRNEVSTILVPKISSQDIILVETPALTRIQEKLIDSTDISTLRVKVNHPDVPSLLIKLYLKESTESLFTLKENICVQVNTFLKSDYKVENIELRTGFPPRNYTTDTNSLKTEGLYPNANLLVKLV